MHFGRARLGASCHLDFTPQPAHRVDNEEAHAKTMKSQAPTARTEAPIDDAN
jgi:hypothetical protein